MRPLSNACHDLPLTFTQRAKPATRHEMTQFHTDEYIDFLQKVTPDNMDLSQKSKANTMSVTIALSSTDFSSSVASALVEAWRGQLV